MGKYEYSVFVSCCLLPLLSSDLLLWVAWRLIKKEVRSDPSLPSSTHPFIRHPSRFPSCLDPFSPPRVFVSVFAFRNQMLRLCLGAFTERSWPSLQCQRCLGNGLYTHTCTHTSFIPSFSLSQLIHTLLWPWDGCMLDPLCPVKHLIFTVCVCQCTSECVYTDKNTPPPHTHLSDHHRLCTNTSTSVSVTWLIRISLCILHLCCRGWMGGICHGDLCPLNKPIYQVAPRSLGDTELFIIQPLLRSLFIFQFKGNLQQKLKK